MKRADIRKGVSNALANIKLEGCTDVSIFGHPFEIGLLKNKHFQEDIIKTVTSELDEIINHNGKFDILKINKISHTLVPKKDNYDFRKCALIDIIDEIKYLSLVNLIAPIIERERVSKNIAFSYRYKISSNGNIFDRKYNYSLFKNKYRQLSSKKKYKIIIECDIANFYDRLNIHRLNSTLLSISSIDTNITKAIDELLLFWANRDSYGLPVGSNASRILAEAFLIEIDNFLLSNNITFCRFVDDYRFFAADSCEASKIMNLFVRILNKHGLSINLSKTKMRDVSCYRNENKKVTTSTKEGLFEIIRGYSGIVPTKFRKLSESETKKLKDEDEERLLNKLKKEVIIEATDIIKTIKIIIAKSSFNCLKEFPEILKKYPQFIPYFSDVILKNREKINKKILDEILEKFSLWLNDYNVPEYILINIVRLFDANNPNEKKILFEFFKGLRRNSGIYVGRVVLEQIGFNFNRGEILEIKDYYLRADNWEKRQIVRIVLNGLSKSENRPFIKDLKINCKDLFIEDMIKEYEKKRNVR